MTTDLSLLTTAAAKWESAAKDFEGVQKTYDSQVKSIGYDGSWTGEANLQARPNMQKTSDQYAAAAKEARAVATLLRDAQAQFTELRGKLKSVVAEAEKNGLKVSEDGTVSSTAPTDRAALHDPDYQAVLAREANKRADWAQKITDMVKVFDDADHGVRMALTAAVQDTDILDGIPNSFNAKAEGDLEKAEAKETIRLAQKLKDGKKLDPDELAEASWLFRDVAQDKKASQLVLATMGPDGTIELTNRLNGLAGSGDKSHREAYDAIQSGLAGTVSAATSDPKSPFYEKWRDGLRKAGPKVVENDGQVQIRGYQSLLTLMSHGKKFTPQFIADLGDDIIAAEKKEPRIWDMPSGKSLSKPPAWLARDPLDTLLGIAGKDPKTAEKFLDPDANNSNGRLHYLLQDRDWKTRYELTGNYSHPDMEQFKRVEDADARKGLASAIEAAATGRTDGDSGPIDSKHSEAQARITQRTVEGLNNKFGDRMPENLRGPIARTIADYATDTHEILTGQNSAYGYEGGLENVLAKGGNSHIAVSQESLIRVIRGVSDDPKNFSLIYNTERAHAAGVLAGTPSHPGRSNVDWDVPSRDVGAAFGALNAIGSDTIMDIRDAKMTWADDVARYGYHLGGAPITGIPIIGDVAQRTLDAAAYDWSKDIKNLAAETARGHLSKEWTKDSMAVKDLIDASMQHHGINAGDAGGQYYNDVKQMRQEAQQSYAASRDQAMNYLR
ncbi:hypothetical protein ACFY1P_34955 [Streptomyces sp. NPDC001407]|uniref:hypothetical protein n=1 Tax=Streptomyces sp. NPDC001407 TaxID=3364573 RepID=UPI0036BB2136